MNHPEEKLIQLLNDEIKPFSMQETASHQLLLSAIGDAEIVLIGEATHGTEEFYQARIELTKLLIKEKGFNAIAIEGDWPSAYAIHRYVQGEGNSGSPEKCLRDFKRFPTWMWANTTIPPFLEWLRHYNDERNDKNKKIGFYGLDLYSMYESIHAVVNYLKLNHPELVKHAIERYSCFDLTAVDPQVYGYLVNEGVKKPCVTAASNQLLELYHLAFNQAQQDDSNDLLFYATQNARLVKNAEHYYRALYESRENTWNIRDTHMLETIQHLMAHIETKLKTPAKIIIWAHNSHVGDARATEMHARGEINLGELIREEFKSFHIGFSTFAGTVTAASNWDEPAQTKILLPAIKGSYEALFHQTTFDNFILFPASSDYLFHLLDLSRLQRAIGVVYRPETERYSHYFFSKLPEQFNAVIHLDKTTALTPLKISESSAS